MDSSLSYDLLYFTGNTSKFIYTTYFRNHGCNDFSHDKYCFLIIECIEHSMMSYIFGVPLFAFLLTYVICNYIKHPQAILFAYFIVCLISYSFFILILPINIFRKITPQLVFLPVISSIAVQLTTNYKDIIFNYTMNGISDKVSSSFLKTTLCL